MILYHYSYSFHDRFLVSSKAESRIFLTTSDTGRCGKDWLFRYEVEIENCDLTVINNSVENANKKEIEYLYDGNKLEYKCYKCLDDDFAPVVHAVIDFRKKMDEAKQTSLKDDTLFCRFPCGCCGDTAVLLKRFIQDRLSGRYNKDIKYCNGIIHRNDLKSYGLRIGQSHAWLEYKDKIIIDVTANQFSEITREPVVITKCRGFHGMFTSNEAQQDLDIDAMPEQTKERLLKIYGRICFA